MLRGMTLKPLKYLFIDIWSPSHFENNYQIICPGKLRYLSGTTSYSVKKVLEVSYLDSWPQAWSLQPHTLTEWFSKGKSHEVTHLRFYCFQWHSTITANVSTSIRETSLSSDFYSLFSSLVSSFSLFLTIWGIHSELLKTRHFPDSFLPSCSVYFSFVCNKLLTTFHCHLANCDSSFRIQYKWNHIISLGKAFNFPILVISLSYMLSCLPCVYHHNI